MSDGPSILEARRITKRFGPITALREVSFDLRAGEIHALCGENGAGKSTLIKVLSGVHPAGSYDGEILVEGKPVGFRGIRDAEKAGLAVIYQELALVEEMTVAENIFLGAELRRGWRIDWDRANVEARGLLKRFGIDLDPRHPVRELGVGQKQLVEIVKALRKNSRILILDEPTAALSESEVAILMKILRDLRDGGVAIVYISHRLEEVKRLANRLTVLRDGATVITLHAERAPIPELIRHMVGREIKDLFPRDRSGGPGEVLLEVKDLEVAAAPGGPLRLSDISFQARAGEVLGLGGLMGAGRSELLMHLFGAWGERRRGEVRLGGKPLGREANPRDSIGRGLVLVTEDRKRFGLHLAQSIGFNLSLSSLDRFQRGPLLDERAEGRSNQRLARDLDVRAHHLGSLAASLSGGNQQKVVLGKALMTGPRVVFLDEPTRGIDVGAKLEIYRLINRLTSEGKAVVLVSSELPELMGMSDRILMLHDGRIGGEFIPGDYSQERLLAAAMGGGWGDTRPGPVQRNQ